MRYQRPGQSPCGMGTYARPRSRISVPVPRIPRFTKGSGLSDYPGPTSRWPDGRLPDCHDTTKITAMVITPSPSVTFPDSTHSTHSAFHYSTNLRLANGINTHSSNPITKFRLARWLNRYPTYHSLPRRRQLRRICSPQDATFLCGLHFFWFRWQSCVRPFQPAWMASPSMRPTTSPPASLT